MSTARSVFTEVIEDHLALKKQNAGLEPAMPLARYDVGDPLERYPGGPNRAAEGTVVIADEAAASPAGEPVVEPSPAEATQLLVGPSPEQAIEAATALEPAFADRPFEPLTGMAPMLSLVEDIDEEDDVDTATPAAAADSEPSGDVLRFPGGVGPREEEPAAEPVLATAAVEPEPEPEPEPSFRVSTDGFNAPEPQQEAAATAHDAPTGEQPVLVIDTDAPLPGADWSEPVEPGRATRARKPRFFGIGRRKSSDEGAPEGWFTDGPRDFNWD